MCCTDFFIAKESHGTNQFNIKIKNRNNMIKKG